MAIYSGHGPAEVKLSLFAMVTALLRLIGERERETARSVHKE